MRLKGGELPTVCGGILPPINGRRSRRDRNIFCAPPQRRVLFDSSCLLLKPPQTPRGICTAVMAVGHASLQQRLERWAQRLNNLTVSPLTRDYPDTQKPDSKRAIEAFESLKLPRDGQLALKKLSGSSPSDFTVFLTAFAVLVARLTGDEDIAVGTSVGDDGRPFVLRVPIDASETFTQLYAKVGKVCLNSLLGISYLVPNYPTGFQRGRIRYRAARQPPLLHSRQVQV